jgi:hypothetical protein
MLLPIQTISSAGKNRSIISGESRVLTPGATRVSNSQWHFEQRHKWQTAPSSAAESENSGAMILSPHCRHSMARNVVAMTNLPLFR